MPSPEDIEKQAADALAQLPQPGPILGHKASEQVDASTTKGNDYLSATVGRVWTGRGIGGLSLLFLGGWLVYSLHALDQAELPTTPLAERVFYIRLAVHAVITLGGIYFLYQVLRAAERLLLPPGVVEKNPQAAALLLGIKSPAEQLDIPAVKAVTELVMRVVEVVRPPK